MSDPCIELQPPLLSDDHIKERISCVRAHRERIGYVGMRLHGAKTVFHNYGHGGAGWTLLFGAVQESVDQFDQHLVDYPSRKGAALVVIGAGCYGLLTAIELARRAHNVTIIAKDIENLSSYHAGGFFFPRHRACSTVAEQELFLQRGIRSYTVYQDIAAGAHAYIAQGAKKIPAYYGQDIDPGFSPFIQQGLMQVPRTVAVRFGKNHIYNLRAYESLFIDAHVMMHELHRVVRELEIPMVKREIASFDELEEDIVFNCAGYGARALADDARVIPVQGHLLLLDQQPQDELQYLINVKVTMRNPTRDELIYFAPKGAGILGITFLRGQDGSQQHEHEFARLLQRSRDFFGTL